MAFVTNISASYREKSNSALADKIKCLMSTINERVMDSPHSMADVIFEDFFKYFNCAITKIPKCGVHSPLRDLKGQGTDQTFYLSSTHLDIFTNEKGKLKKIAQAFDDDNYRFLLYSGIVPHITVNGCSNTQNSNNSNFYVGSPGNAALVIRFAYNRDHYLQCEVQSCDDRLERLKSDADPEQNRQDEMRKIKAKRNNYIEQMTEYTCFAFRELFHPMDIRNLQTEQDVLPDQVCVDIYEHEPVIGGVDVLYSPTFVLKKNFI